MIRLVIVFLSIGLNAQAFEIKTLRGPVDLKVGDEIWLENEAVGFILSQIKPFLGELYQPLVENVQKVRLIKEEKNLDVRAFLNEKLHLVYKDYQDTKVLGVYGFKVPREFHFKLSLQDGVLRIFGLEDGYLSSRFAVLARIPVLPDAIYPHWVEANMQTGQLSASIGILWDIIPLEVSTQINKPADMVSRKTWDMFLIQSSKDIKAIVDSL